MADKTGLVNQALQILDSHWSGIFTELSTETVRLPNKGYVGLEGSRNGRINRRERGERASRSEGDTQGFNVESK